LWRDVFGGHKNITPELAAVDNSTRVIIGGHSGALTQSGYCIRTKSIVQYEYLCTRQI
jgi:hypothetical protein